MGSDRQRNTPSVKANSSRPDLPLLSREKELALAIRLEKARNRYRRAVLFGWWGFGEVPDAYTIVGATLIIATGLYIYARERVAARGVQSAP